MAQAPECFFSALLNAKVLTIFHMSEFQPLAVLFATLASGSHVSVCIGILVSRYDGRKKCAQKYFNIFSKGHAVGLGCVSVS